MFAFPARPCVSVRSIVIFRTPDPAKRFAFAVPFSRCLLPAIPPFLCSGLPRTHSVVRHPRTAQRCLDAAVTGPDDIGRNGANKGIKCLCVDGIDNPLADLLRIKPRRCETLGVQELASRLDDRFSLLTE